MQKDTDTGPLNLTYCCLQKSLGNYYLVRDTEEFERDLNLEMHEKTKDCGFLVGWHNFELFSVPPARHLPMYAPVPVF